MSLGLVQVSRNGEHGIPQMSVNRLLPCPLGRCCSDAVKGSEVLGIADRQKSFELQLLVFLHVDS